MARKNNDIINDVYLVIIASMIIGGLVGYELGYMNGAIDVIHNIEQPEQQYVEEWECDEWELVDCKDTCDTDLFWAYYENGTPVECIGEIICDRECTKEKLTRRLA